ncbi:MAG: cytidine deaminase [Theionarchaea archaeon]|nr:cytidine deaminase [Theionarchaea archaeon]
MDDYALMEMARKASEKSYSPYSEFQVGAALLTIDGDIITGCNVENVSYGLTMCAERIAFFKAVSQGKKKGDFIKIAVAGKPHADDWKFCSPCGACRQVISEFAGEKPIQVVYMDSNGSIKSVSIDELLPDAFTSLR